MTQPAQVLSGVSFTWSQEQERLHSVRVRAHSTFSLRTQNSLFWTMPPLVNTTLGDHAHMHTHMQCENGSGPTQRQHSQSSPSPAQLWQAALSGGCVTLTSVLSCPAADINTWHISQISPIKQDNSLQLQMVFPARMCVFQIFMVFTKLRSPFH